MNSEHKSKSRQGVQHDLMGSRTMETRYQRAQVLLDGAFKGNLALNDALIPHWIAGPGIVDSDSFWYERSYKKTGNEPSTIINNEPSSRIDKVPTVGLGREFRLVSAKVASNTIAFDHDALASALAQVSGHAVDKEDLPFRFITTSLIYSLIKASGMTKSPSVTGTARLNKEELEHYIIDGQLASKSTG